MPQGTPENCDADCAADVAAYLWSYKRENVIADGGFEGSMLSGWTTWNASVLALSSASSYSGEQSLSITGRADDGAYAVFNVTSLVTANTTYMVRAQARHTGMAADTLRLAAKVSCETPPAEHNEYPWLHHVENVPMNQWTLLTGELVIPDCEVVDVAIFFEGTTAEVNVFLDEVYLVPPGGAQEPEPEVNLIANGDFETDTAGWFSFDDVAALSASTDEANSGSRSLLADRSGASSTGGFAATDLTSLIAGGSSYAVTAWAKHMAAGPDTLRMAAVIECTTPPEDHNAYPWLHSVSEVPADQWTQLSALLEIPDCGPTNVLVYFEGTSAGVDVYIDSVSVTAQ